MMFFSTDTASAQVESSEEEQRISDAKTDEESTPSGQIGFYFSLYGAIYEALPLDGAFYSEEIPRVPDDDVMPYPSFFMSFRYKNIGGIIGIEDDGDNERISILMLRYHQYVNKNMYAFGGPVLWRFNKEYNFTYYTCIDYDYEAEPYVGIDTVYPCKPGAEVQMETETDRPDGRSLTFGITTGLGVEYTLGGALVFSHELEVFASPCQYRDFICFGGDLKFFGVHLKF